MWGQVEVDDLNHCHLCDGPLMELGTLGCLVHFKCRDCGAMCHADVEEWEIN